jgi:hypothetical protein
MVVAYQGVLDGVGPLQRRGRFGKAGQMGSLLKRSGTLKALG